MGNTIDEDIEKINRYIAYLQKYGNQYYNAFEVLNTSENSFSEFIAWLFDIEKVTEKKEESIQYYFIKEFLKKLWKDEQDTKIKEKYKQLDFNNFFDKFIENCIVNTQKDNIN